MSRPQNPPGQSVSAAWRVHMRRPRHIVGVRIDPPCRSCARAWRALIAGGAQCKTGNEKAFVRALYYQRRDEGYNTSAVPPRLPPSASLYSAEARATSQARPVRCVDAHPAYLRHQRMPHCIGRFLRLAAPELVRATQIHPRLSLCPGSLSDAYRLLLSVNADLQALFRCLPTIMTCNLTLCQGWSLIVQFAQWFQPVR